MKKRIIVFLSSLVAVSTLLVCNSADAKTLWRCVATSKSGAVWYQYASARAKAASNAMSRCRKARHSSACSIRCYPPRTRMRCVAADRSGKTWYWVSAVKKTARENARIACINNSKVGGCRSGSCAAS